MLPPSQPRRRSRKVPGVDFEGKVVVVTGSAGDGAYSATKHAALGLAEWLAFTYGGQGVRVSCICPGAVDTAMLRGGTGGDAAKASAVIGGGEVLSPDTAAERILDALEQDR